MEIKVINLATLEAIIAHLMWISRNTLDFDRLLTNDEYLEVGRAILDRIPIDYNDAEQKYLDKQASLNRRPQLG